MDLPVHRRLEQWPGTGPGPLASGLGKNPQGKDTQALGKGMGLQWDSCHRAAPRPFPPAQGHLLTLQALGWAGKCNSYRYLQIFHVTVSDHTNPQPPQCAVVWLLPQALQHLGFKQQSHHGFSEGGRRYSKNKLGLLCSFLFQEKVQPSHKLTVV